MFDPPSTLKRGGSSQPHTRADAHLTSRAACGASRPPLSQSGTELQAARRCPIYGPRASRGAHQGDRHGVCAVIYTCQLFDYILVRVINPLQEIGEAAFFFIVVCR